ncbi:hypothetical protein Agabi119p4_10814 [Agaricus bisporus var. burnettii]|uniref:Phytase A n=1 Tax=Agaricus bisporus var. burnettii TaxID=192524 RepID=A0A8H7C0T0_AGABI|nr:hypothetical protein Agabi119p4_10814 [Agaricus bisporus var. burnettii]
MVKYEEDKNDEGLVSKATSYRKFRPELLFTGIVILILVAFSCKVTIQERQKSFLDSAKLTFIPADIQHLWGILSPYHVQNTYEDPPPECSVNQVNILHRHGARLPELADQKAMMASVKKYQKAKGYCAEELQFLNGFSYDLGSESLVQLGAEQSWSSGVDAYSRYSNLVDKNHLPFIRVSLSDRVVMSARNWSAGFHECSRQYRPKISVYIDEGPHSNNTLFNSNCPNAHAGDKQVDQWVDIYANPIAHRLNSAAIDLPENLTAKDVFYLMMMCPFESVYHREYSPFCGMFNITEFKGFEYAIDLEQYYTTGYGQDQGLGRVQGVGYVNELLARLTNRTVKDGTQTNHTLDDNKHTFPLDKKMYVDFSHDHLMTAVYSAIGLFNTSRLDPTEINQGRSWRSSEIMPFSTRMSVERLDCSARTPGRFYNSWSENVNMKERNGDYVRILVNDVVQRLEFCGGDKEGLCELAKFVDSQGYARSNGNGDFDRCGYEPSGDISLSALSASLSSSIPNLGL